MTGRVYLTPEAERQLHQIDDWIAEHATADLARDFVSAILGHIEGEAALSEESDDPGVDE